MSEICPVRYNANTWARHRMPPESSNTRDAITSAPAVHSSSARLVRMLGLRAPRMDDSRIGSGTIALGCRLWTSDASACDSTRHAPCRRSTPGDEPIERTEGPQRGEANEVESRHTAFEPMAEDRTSSVRLNGGPEQRVNHRQLVDVHPVARRQDDVIRGHRRSIR